LAESYGCTGGVAAGQLKVTALDAAWVPVPLGADAGTGVTTVGGNAVGQVANASEMDSALYVLDNGASSLIAVAFGADGSFRRQVTLVQGSWSGAWDLGVDVTWGGSVYIVGWWQSGWAPYYALVDANGDQIGGSALPPIVVGTPVRVAGNGQTLALAYQEASDNAVVLQLLDTGGNMLGAPLEISAVGDAGYTGVSVLAVAGAPEAYVVLWAHNSQTWATYVPVLADRALSSATQTVLADHLNVPQTAHGGYDGVGAAFLMQYTAGTSLGFLNGSMLNPFELGELAASGSGGILAGGTGGRLGVSYGQNGTYYAHQAGFCSLSGVYASGFSACCVADTDCCSQSCVNGTCQ
jgi:hypothetical protein